MGEQKGRIVSSLKQVARHYGVAYATVRQDWRPSGMPGRRGHWDLDAIDQWRTLRASPKDRTGTLTPDGAAASEPERTGVRAVVSQAKEKAALADARKKDADARIKEILARRAENLDLVELAEVEAFLTSFLAEARNILLAIPVKLKRFGPDVMEAATEELKLGLHAVRKKMERLADLRRDS